MAHNEIEDGFGCAGLVPSQAEREEEQQRKDQTLCITRVSRSLSGKAFAVYLRDGTKITIGRKRETKGEAWLEIGEQARIVLLSSGVEAARSAEAIRHGQNCPKVAHKPEGGYLHRDDDDSPYDVDGYTYCGRCHHAI